MYWPYSKSGVLRYQFYHTFALYSSPVFCTKILICKCTFIGPAAVHQRYRLFIQRVLYLLTYTQASGNTGPAHGPGIITPFGGAAFIVGWILFFISFFIEIETMHLMKFSRVPVKLHVVIGEPHECLIHTTYT